MSVLVTDAQGNPVSGETVSLGLWPTAYRTGAWYWTQVGDKEKYMIYTSGIFPNEDVNMNGYNDVGEDRNLDGQLTPSSSTGGEVPDTVTTDEYGFAHFELKFLKTYAVWVTDRIRATTTVLATETTAYIDLTLPYEKVEGEGGFLQNSPWPYVLASTNSRLFPAISDPATDQYSSLVGLPDGVFDVDNYYTYTGLPTVGNTASDTITVSGYPYAYPSVSFPVRIVFPTP